MATQPPNPLTEADLEEMNRKLLELDEADKVIDKAVRAGIDMTGPIAKSREVREQLLRLKQAFFPGR
jgi:hypothetical protein